MLKNITAHFQATLAAILRRIKQMRAEPQAHLVALTGAVMVFTPGGVVLLTPSAARAVARELPALANLADKFTLQSLN